MLDEQAAACLLTSSGQDHAVTATACVDRRLYPVGPALDRRQQHFGHAGHVSKIFKMFPCPCYPFLSLKSPQHIIVNRVDIVTPCFALKNRLQCGQLFGVTGRHVPRSEEHTSELQSLMRISYAVFCLKKKKQCTTVQLRIDTNKQ